MSFNAWDLGEAIEIVDVHVCVKRSMFSSLSLSLSQTIIPFGRKFYFSLSLIIARVVIRLYISIKWYRTYNPTGQNLNPSLNSG